MVYETHRAAPPCRAAAVVRDAAGKGAVAFVPLPLWRDPERDQRSELHDQIRNTTRFAGVILKEACESERASQGRAQTGVSRHLVAPIRLLTKIIVRWETAKIANPEYH
jgi:hypothetical protein